MANGERLPAEISSKLGTRLVISQEELNETERMEDAVIRMRELLQGKLQQGASVEPGALKADVRALTMPLHRLAKRGEEIPVPNPPRDRAAMKLEPEADGGLTFGELRTLRDFHTIGRFQPAVLRSIVDRLETLAEARFAQNRERMRELQEFNIGNWLLFRIKFAYKIRLARLFIRLHELGFTQFKVSILSEILSINRDHFSVADVSPRLS